MAKKEKREPSVFGKIMKVILIIIGVILLVALAYLAYVLLSYSRIEDNQEITPGGAAQEEVMPVGESHTIYTNNVGFGAYTPDFSFFMDGGTSSWANSKASVENCTALAEDEAASFDPDIILFQEVDFDSTRNYHVDMRAAFEERFADYSSAFAVNYHSAFLFYPFTQPHGASNSGILTLSKYRINSSTRRSFEISTGFSKFLDLDRCYSKSRIALDNGKELVIYNVHSSAYGGSDAIRTSQMTMLFGDMQEEYDNGNYCICGGDFNHDFTGTSLADLNPGRDVTAEGWAQPFPEDLLTENLVRQINYTNGEIIGTCRDTGSPLTETTEQYILDGFVTTDNITVERLENIPTGYTYSDHQPVFMQFRLNAE